MQPVTPNAKALPASNDTQEQPSTISTIANHPITKVALTVFGLYLGYKFVSAVRSQELDSRPTDSWFSPMLQSLYVPATQAEKAATLVKELQNSKYELYKNVDVLKGSLEDAGLIAKRLYGDELVAAIQNLAQTKDVWVNSTNWAFIEAFNKHLPVIEESLSKIVELQAAATEMLENITNSNIAGYASLPGDLLAYLGWASDYEKQLRAIYEMFKSASETAVNFIKGK